MYPEHPTGRRRPMPSGNLALGKAHRPPPAPVTLEQLYRLLENNNRLLLALTARLDLLEIYLKGDIPI